MPLSPGTQLGAYNILSLAGSGGMGEVYRARDTKLNRDVALKILPDAFAGDPERLARFKREAQTLAALNHPNIAAIYGFEESPAEAGRHVGMLVMELVEGEDLSQKIEGLRAKGSGLPLDEALPIAKQIAEALEAAHAQGIIHRDLKPANVKVRDDGTVKVLDFGLAKALDTPGASNSSVSMSPTLTTPAMMTGVGAILGTAAYMSPEQAKGRAADTRSDVWAFGCVLYEMLTGARPFEGEDVADTLAAVLRGTPDWTTLPSSVTPQIRLLLERCLEKDRRKRIADISTVRFLLTETIPSGSHQSPATSPQVTSHQPQATRLSTAIAWSIAGAAILVSGALLFLWSPWRSAPSPKPVRFTVAAAGTMPLSTGSPFRDFALSPDGERLVYITGTGPTSSEMWVRAVDQLDAVQFRGLATPVAPFISPDSKWIGFFSSGQIRKVSMTGGPAIYVTRLIAGTGAGSQARGASWAQNDTIVFATADVSTGLLAVSANGGEPAVLTTPDPKQGELDHVFPSVLPSGQAVLFTITNANGPDTSQVAVLDLKTGQRKTLIRGGGAAEYVSSGHILYAAAGSLRAVRFDPVRLEVLSDPVPVVEHVVTKGTGSTEFSVSRQGALVYLPGGVAGPNSGAQRTLVWVDRKGHEEPVKAPPRAYQRGALSPDGTRIALDVRDQENDIWIWDIAHETLTRLTVDPTTDSFPVWTADSRRVIFNSGRNGSANLYWQMADGSGPVERLTTSTNTQVPLSMSPDGTAVTVRENRASSDVLLLHLDGTHAMDALLQTTFAEDNGVVSPDGHWLAYDSNESGQLEIYVRPFPNVNGGHFQISTRGGHAPLWAPNGRELFYLDATDHLMAVPIQPPANGVFNFGGATKLLDTVYYTPRPARAYDVSRDGQKFLMIKDSAAPNSSGATSTAQTPTINMVVVLNWTEELKARVPVK
jgi:serine/threonine-protein kinase